jgi:hypothetical protein
MRVIFSSPLSPSYDLRLIKKISGMISKLQFVSENYKFGVDSFGALIWFAWDLVLFRSFSIDIPPYPAVVLD